MAPGPTPAEIIDNFHNGIFECPYCELAMSLQHTHPLQMVSCPDCGNVLLVPTPVAEFWLFQVVGGGGMGVVYKAFHEIHRRSIYAIKLVPQRGKNRRRLSHSLQREAQMATRFSGHPNIANVVCHGWHQDEFYMASEYIRGETLTKRIERRGRLDEIEALTIAADLVSAIRHIHSLNYLFRDVKPDNVMINEQGLPMLFDFGLCIPCFVAARDLGEVIEASPVYVPPERLMGDGEGIQAEIYSLGMVLYQMLVGTTYFAAREANSLLRQHVSEFRLHRSVTGLDSVSPDLVELITSMVCREPDDRPQSAEGLEQTLREMLAQRVLAQQEETAG